MAKIPKRSGGRKAAKVSESHPAAPPPTRARPLRKATNLTLEPEAIARGEQFAQKIATSLSQLVNSFLHALPGGADDAEYPALSPQVSRLYGVAAPGTSSRESYRQHIAAKYGTRD